jgi:hypothetical protein
MLTIERRQGGLILSKEFDTVESMDDYLNKLAIIGYGVIQNKAGKLYQVCPEDEGVPVYKGRRVGKGEVGV